MLTLTIVDDEKTTRDSIQSLIPWAEFGIGRVDTASNGIAALELARQAKPDIVLTDVRMPKMDGIELARKIREIYPLCKIIFISGYSDKEYLKTAINLKAISYIEKPLNIEEIKSVLRETVDLCLAEERRRNDDIKMMDRLNENLPLIYQKAAFNLIEEHADIPGIQAKYHIPLLDVPAADGYVVLCVAFNWVFGLDACVKSAAKSDVLQLLSAGSAGISPTYVAGFIEDDRLVYIAPISNTGQSEAAVRMLQIISPLSEGKFTASVGIGKDTGGLLDIPDAYRTAAESVKLQFYDCCGQVFEAKNDNRKKYTADKNLMKSFRDALRGNRLYEASQLISAFTDSVRNFRSSEIESVKNLYFHLLMIVFEVARERDLIGKAEENEQCYIWQEIERIRLMSELSEYLLNTMKAALPQVGPDESENRKIAEINRYIRENISDKLLSVQTVAHSIFLNHQYLCSYYKKATGKTVNDFITEVRMEKAKELLLNKKIKIYDVTTRIGLTDSNYFSTLFKKYTGCTPSEYRERN